MAEAAAVAALEAVSAAVAATMRIRKESPENSINLDMESVAEVADLKGDKPGKG